MALPWGRMHFGGFSLSAGQSKNIVVDNVGSFQKPYEKAEAKGYYLAKKRNSPDNVFLRRMVGPKGRMFIDYDYQALQGYHEDIFDRKQESHQKLDNLLSDIARKRQEVNDASAGLFGLGMDAKDEAREKLDEYEREARAAKVTVEKNYKSALLTNKLPLLNSLAVRIKRREKYHPKAGATERGMVKIFDKVRGSYA